jgi:hypothetical protein
MLMNGMGDLTKAGFHVPEQTIKSRGVGDLVDARFHSPEMTIQFPGSRHMGDLVDARFSLPEQTIVGLGGFTDTWTWKEYAAIGGGLLLMAWYFTEGRKMFRTHRERPAAVTA